ncbi:MAG: serine hydrolase domain-containing protein [Gemmatimonadales bacterium]
MAKNFAVALLASAASLAGRPAHSQDLPEIVDGLRARRIDELMTRAAGFGFAGQLVVEIDGRLALHRAYGVADRATGRPMTLDTPLGIASMSKMIAATAILRLQDAGRLSVRDRLGDLLPDVPADKAGITVHQLLTHTSGIAGGDIAGDFELASRRELLDRILAQPLAAPPGTRWSYANSGYSLLAAIVEAVSGRPYHEFLRDEVFRTAGMTRSGLWDHPANGSDRPATAYQGLRAHGAPPDWPANWRVYGAGDVLSTAGDLYRFDRALREHRLLRERTVRAMTSKQAEVDDQVGFGYATFVYGEPGRRVNEHGGDWQQGYNGVFFRYPDEKMLIVLTSNARDQSGMWLRHSVQATIEKLARGEAVAEQALPPPSQPVEVGDRAALPGTWWLSDGSRVEIVDDGSSLWAAAAGQGAVDALASRPADDRSASALAASSVTRLLAGLLLGEAERSYREALREEGARFLDDYLAEWRGVVDRHGALLGFDLLGSTRRREVVTVVARLRLERGTVDFQLSFAERGGGRLAGSFVRPWFFQPGYPVAVPIRRSGSGLVAHDLFGGWTTSILVEREDSGRIARLLIGPDRVPATRGGEPRDLAAAVPGQVAPR